MPAAPVPTSSICQKHWSSLTSFAYEEQLEHIEGCGGRAILMASSALRRVATSRDDYLTVYGRLIDGGRNKVILHWLGDMFDQPIWKKIASSLPLEADEFGALKDLVRHDYGWTVLPTAPIFGDIGDGRLSAAPVVEPVPERRLVLSYLADRLVPRLARFAGEAIVSFVGEHANRGVGAVDNRPEARL